jgi:hypothetical protein
VGRHVDHQLTYQVALLLGRAGHVVRFYEDIPYALDEARLSAALTRRKKWQREECALSETDLDRKLAAVSEYKSQLPSLFGDERRMREKLRAHAVEKVWSKAH